MPIILAGIAAALGASVSGVTLYDRFFGAPKAVSPSAPVVVQSGVSVMEIALVVGLAVVAVKVAK